MAMLNYQRVSFMNQVCITCSRFQNCIQYWDVGRVYLGMALRVSQGRMVPHIKHGRMVLDLQLNLRYFAWCTLWFQLT